MTLSNSNLRVQMKISLIAAMGRNRVIGLNNQMPWHLPADLKHFKQLTLGKPIIMGRNTFESIGKPLPGRQNIVVTRNSDWQAEGVTIAHSLDSAIALAGQVDEIMIIGGGQIYKAALSLATHCYFTFIDAEFEGDAFFPAWQTKDWAEVARETHQDDAFTYHFVTLQR